MEREIIDSIGQYQNAFKFILGLQQRGENQDASMLELSYWIVLRLW